MSPKVTVTVKLSHWNPNDSMVGVKPCSHKKKKWYSYVIPLTYIILTAIQRVVWDPTTDDKPAVLTTAAWLASPALSTLTPSPGSTLGASANAVKGLEMNVLWNVKEAQKGLGHSGWAAFLLILLAFSSFKETFIIPVVPRPQSQALCVLQIEIYTHQACI